MARGMLTQEVKDLTQKLFGYQFTARELRLLLYVDYTIKNSKQIMKPHINHEEELILENWKERGWVNGSYAKFEVSKDFYDKMQQVLWVAYVDYEL